MPMPRTTALSRPVPAPKSRTRVTAGALTRSKIH